ncbi:MAG: hypothetical protein JXA97_13120 [Anaerolineales bacterium]|nr:hypothetical protein [Anaerolineales bacterium]
MSTHRSTQHDPIEGQLSRALKAWAGTPKIPADIREQLLQCAADEACSKDPVSTTSVMVRLWKLFSFQDDASVIAPSMQKEMKKFQGRGDDFTFGFSVYALQNAISVGACLVRTS